MSSPLYEETSELETLAATKPLSVSTTPPTSPPQPSFPTIRRQFPKVVFKFPPVFLPSSRQMDQSCTPCPLGAQRRQREAENDASFELILEEKTGSWEIYPSLYNAQVTNWAQNIIGKPFDKLAKQIHGNWVTDSGNDSHTLREFIGVRAGKRQLLPTGSRTGSLPYGATGRAWPLVNPPRHRKRGEPKVNQYDHGWKGLREPQTEENVKILEKHLTVYEPNGIRYQKGWLNWRQKITFNDKRRCLQRVHLAQPTKMWMVMHVDDDPATMEPDYYHAWQPWMEDEDDDDTIGAMDLDEQHLYAGDEDTVAPWGGGDVGNELLQSLDDELNESLDTHASSAEDDTAVAPNVFFQEDPPMADQSMDSMDLEIVNSSEENGWSSDNGETDEGQDEDQDEDEDCMDTLDLKDIVDESYITDDNEAATDNDMADDDAPPPGTAAWLMASPTPTQDDLDL
ncbi:hypothetical protein BT63DRAFT_422215 [Microthyrium microscopicum]|uniref:Uncharacterized protein n=1 Tax=Microthyrium microscopicum TaxID=703497 RepID=A0A6A6UIZ8_9PEZI|nr:hypothetical protein BT63DRAFT_422215 [Microthyrium microscopicum]